LLGGRCSFAHVFGGIHLHWSFSEQSQGHYKGNNGKQCSSSYRPLMCNKQIITG
jgi:hypothetical protein